MDNPIIKEGVSAVDATSLFADLNQGFGLTDDTPAQELEIPTEILLKLKAYRLDLSIEPTPPQAVLAIGDAPICTRGNFSIVSGIAGSKKTFFCTGVASAFLKGSGFCGMTNPDREGGKRLLWIDTEQHADDTNVVAHRLKRMVGIAKDENPADIIFYPLRECDSAAECKVLVGAAMAYYKPDFVILDGCTDLINNPNDPEESKTIIRTLMSWSSKYNCHIMTVIHINEGNTGNDAARGHVGREGTRKGETRFLLTPHGYITEVKFARTRRKLPKDFAFEISEDELPVQCDYTFNATTEKTDINNRMLEEILENGVPMKRCDIIKEIMHRKGCKDSTAGHIVRDAVKMKVLFKGDDGLYSLNIKNDHDNELPF